MKKNLKIKYLNHVIINTGVFSYVDIKILVKVSVYKILYKI